MKLYKCNRYITSSIKIENYWNENSLYSCIETSMGNGPDYDKGNGVSSDLKRSSTKSVHTKLRRKNTTIWKKKSLASKSKDSFHSKSPKLRKKVCNDFRYVLKSQFYKVTKRYIRVRWLFYTPIEYHDIFMI